LGRERLGFVDGTVLNTRMARLRGRALRGERLRATNEGLFEEELAGFLGRLHCGRGEGRARGYRHGHCDRQLSGTFGTETVRVPRARFEGEAGKVGEWRSKALPRYPRLTKKAGAPIAAVYLAGALLHESAAGRAFAFPGQPYPATSAMGVPSAVKPFGTATRTGNSAA